MKVIFLDIDGVLNSSEHNARCFMQGAPSLGPGGYIDASAVKHLNELVRQTGAKLVLSSTWRILDPLWAVDDFLRQHGLCDEAEFLGITPNFGKQGRFSGQARAERGEEIQAWLTERASFQVSPVTSFVILDDDSDMAHLGHRLVQTDWLTGMLDTHLPLAAAILNTPIGSLPGDVVGSDP